MLAAAPSWAVLAEIAKQAAAAIGAEVMTAAGRRGGSEEGAPGPDLVLGAFYLGACPPEKMDAYRAKRGDIREKVQWLY